LGDSGRPPPVDHWAEEYKQRAQPQSRLLREKGISNVIDLIPKRATALLLRAMTDATRDEGQALIEYALIVSLIGLVAIVSLKTLGTNVSGVLNKVAGEV
jgi:Flp pilus assembly pilin Flp